MQYAVTVFFSAIVAFIASVSYWLFDAGVLRTTKHARLCARVSAAIAMQALALAWVVSSLGLFSDGGPS